jgi:hypothetical protein
MLACMLAAPRRDYARLGAETGPPAVTALARSTATARGVSASLASRFAGPDLLAFSVG